MTSSRTLSTSPSLVARVKAREPQAWHRLVSLYGPLVYRWARQAGLQDNDAADIGQEVFLRVHKAIDSFQHGQPGQTFRGWLWTIARNQIRAYFGAQAKEVRGEGGSDALRLFAQLPEWLERDAEPNDAGAQASLARRALQLVRGDFSDETWQAFWRVTVDGHEAADVAADLNMSVQAVRQAKYRVLVRMREELAG